MLSIETIATVLDTSLIIVAFIGYWLATALLIGWFFGKDQEEPDFLEGYYDSLLDGFYPPSKTYPEGNYHPEVGFVPAPSKG